jgi:hypothetical protein
LQPAGAEAFDLRSVLFLPDTGRRPVQAGVDLAPGYEELLERTRMEYVEMPDMYLTRWQARRLWSLESTVCDNLLAVLVGDGFLVETRHGSFLRRRPDRPTLPLSA